MLLCLFGGWLLLLGLQPQVVERNAHFHRAELHEHLTALRLRQHGSDAPERHHAHGIAGDQRPGQTVALAFVRNIRLGIQPVDGLRGFCLCRGDPLGKVRLVLFLLELS